jgi:hypothetical protein
MHLVRLSQHASAAARSNLQVRATPAVTICREWAEDHWEAVGVIVSILCAVMAATILTVAYNLIAPL